MKAQKFLVFGLLGCAAFSVAIVSVAVVCAGISRESEQSVLRAASSTSFGPVALLDVGEALVTSKSPSGDIPDISVSEVVSKSKSRLMQGAQIGASSSDSKRPIDSRTKQQYPRVSTVLGTGSDAKVSEQSQDVEVLILDRSLDVTEQSLNSLAKRNNLRTLYIRSNGLTDDALKYVGQVPSLKNLYLAMNRFTDKGIRNLKALPHVEFVDLSNTAVSGAGLRYAFGEKQLEGLVAASMFLKDDDLLEISKMKVRRLSLANNPLITDKGVEFICNMTELERLDLSECPKLSIASRRKIATRLPHCRLGTIFDGY